MRCFPTFFAAGIDGLFLLLRDQTLRLLSGFLVELVDFLPVFAERSGKCRCTPPQPGCVCSLQFAAVAATRTGKPPPAASRVAVDRAGLWCSGVKSLWWAIRFWVQ